MALTHYGPQKERARKFRREETDAEKKLWSRLRGRQLNGFKFRRQFPIGPFFTDFCCLESRLIVELDGCQHMEMQDRDAHRTAWLIHQGFRVLRFWNTEILQVTETICEQILEACKPHPNPLLYRRGSASEFSENPSPVRERVAEGQVRRRQKIKGDSHDRKS